MVESRCGAVALGRTYLLPPLSSGGALVVPPWLRFHIPLIEPDRQISRIRLSDKTSRFLRSLPSTGVTRLPRYYEPLRHPRAPSLSLTGFRLVIADHALGLPVFRALSLCTCRRHYPGAASERSLRSFHPDVSVFRWGCRVDLRIVLFKACSAFTRVAACTLALSPIRDTLIEGFSHFVTSMTAPIASGWSDCRVGLAPTGKRRLCTAHTQLGHQPSGTPAKRMSSRTRLAPARNVGSVLTALLRLLPAGAIAGWGLHPLESAAFARRTPNSDISPQAPRPSACRQGRVWLRHGTLDRYLPRGLPAPGAVSGEG
ncbi:hypothetical protein V1290_005308 [Bradyrhizobium sp. AZCC 1578]